jgi:hypothetical protein
LVHLNISSRLRCATLLMLPKTSIKPACCLQAATNALSQDDTRVGTCIIHPSDKESGLGLRILAHRSQNKQTHVLQYRVRHLCTLLVEVGSCILVPQAHLNQARICCCVCHCCICWEFFAIVGPQCADAWVSLGLFAQINEAPSKAGRHLQLSTPLTVDLAHCGKEKGLEVEVRPGQGP